MSADDNLKAYRLMQHMPPDESQGKPLDSTLHMLLDESQGKPTDATHAAPMHIRNYITLCMHIFVYIYICVYSYTYIHRQENSYTEVKPKVKSIEPKLE